MSSGGSSSHLRKRVGKYFLGRTIGEGTYAKVKYGQHAETGEAVAIKVLDKEALVRSGMVDQIKREITILKQIRHPHIVNLLEVMSSRDKIFMVMELVTGGELFDKVVAEGPMKEPVARRMFSQLLDAVGHCHEQGIYHRDLKPENVLLSSNGSVKLSDFGLGALPNPGGSDALLRTTCGTPNYVAPEVLAKQGYRGGPADIWSLGVVLYVMLAGCLPFDEDDLVALFSAISRARYEVPPWLSGDAVALLKGMLNPDPDARPSIDQLWQHPWMRSGLMRRSVAGWQAPAAAAQADIFAPNVEPELIRTAYQKDSTRRMELVASPGGSLRKANAFDLIKTGLDISALFEARDDVVTRRTRFSSRAPLPAIAASIESAAVAVGGRVTREEEGRLRLDIPNPRGTMQVLVEVVEVTAGMRMVDLQKVRGNSVEFYNWYSDLTGVLSSIISRKAAGPAGSLGARASAVERQQREANGELRTNAFQLIAGCFNMGALFEEEEATSRHAQFSSRRPPADILAALEAAAAALGGSMVRAGERHATLTLPVRGTRTMRLHAHLIEVLKGIHVCQIDKEAGNSLDFMRCYAQLAARLQPVMMKHNAFPTATRAASLLKTTSSMDESERQAIADLPSSSNASGAASPRSASAALESAPSGSLAQRLAEAAALGGGSSFCARNSSRASLGSVPEEAAVPVDHNSSSSSMQEGSSPPAGSSPGGPGPEPLPTLREGSPSSGGSSLPVTADAAAVPNTERPLVSS